VKDNELPYFPAYPRRWLGSQNVSAMPLIAEGAYWRLLNHQWIDGSVPQRPLKLLRVSAVEWRSIWRHLRPCFHKIAGSDRMVNPQLERIRDEVIESRRKHAESGAKGAAVRWGSNGDPIAAPSPRHSDPIAIDSSKRKEKERESTKEKKEGGSVGTSTTYVRRSSSVLSGELPRDHVDHAFCDEHFSHCVPRAVHAKLTDRLAPKYDGDRNRARSELIAWYPQAIAQAGPGHVMSADAFRWWSAAFDRSFASALPTGTAGDSIEAQAERLREMLQHDDSDPLLGVSHGRK